MISESTGSDVSKRADQLLKRLHVDAMPIKELSELRATYNQAYVEPLLEDAVTYRLGQLIELKVSSKLQMRLGGRVFPPVAAYVITGYDQSTFESQQENTYADDSIHIPEFPEAYKNRPVQYKTGELISAKLDPGFYYLVKPRYYLGHSWENRGLDLDSSGSFRLPADVLQAVVFAIIVEKGVSGREYKLIWVFEHTN